MKEGGESNEFKVWVINTLNGQSLMILFKVVKEWISGQDFDEQFTNTNLILLKAIKFAVTRKFPGLIKWANWSIRHRSDIEGLLMEPCYRSTYLCLKSTVFANKLLFDELYVQCLLMMDLVYYKSNLSG